MCVHAHVRACMRACVHACVHLCVCARPLHAPTGVKTGPLLPPSRRGSVRQPGCVGRPPLLLTRPQPGEVQCLLVGGRVASATVWRRMDQSKGHALNACTPSPCPLPRLPCSCCCSCQACWGGALQAACLMWRHAPPFGSWRARCGPFDPCRHLFIFGWAKARAIHAYGPARLPSALHTSSWLTRR